MTNHSNYKLSGDMVRRLMRRHRVTIRTLAVKYNLTLQRVRQVRTEGVTGLAANEWHFLITGSGWIRSQQPQTQKLIMKTTTVYRLQLMQRALNRTDDELHGNRHLYMSCAFKLAAKIIAGSYE